MFFGFSLHLAHVLSDYKNLKSVTLLLKRIQRSIQQLKIFFPWSDVKSEYT